MISSENAKEIGKSTFNLEDFNKYFKLITCTKLSEDKVNFRKLSVVFILFFAVPLFAQKFGYVHSQKVLADFQEYRDVENKLREIQNKYDSEYQQMVKEYQQMADEIESQSLLLSPEKKEEKLATVQQKGLEIEKYRYEKLGPEGEFYKRQSELVQPVIDKINKVIQKIGNDEGYDFIFDAANGTVLHALPKYDITEQVLEELNKQSAAQGGTSKK